MAKMPDNFIDLTVTSPPYDNLRTYNGYSFVFESVAKELYRVTKKGGVVVWVVGDATIKGSETGTSFKQALYFKEIGFNLHDTMIYLKPSVGGARGSLRAYNQAFEYMFVFSKENINKANIIKDVKNKNGGRLVKYSSSGVNGGSSEDKKKVCALFGRRSNVWKIETVKSKNNGHPAPFPEQLANDHIISWSNEGDLVYDPFMGSGTTAKMAIINKRNWIGSEISEEYCKIAERRITTAST